MNNVSHIRSFQQRLAQSQSAKAGLKPADQVHWDTVTANVEDPEIARMILRFCDRSAPEIKTRQPGLYLRAKMVLAKDYQVRVNVAREARGRRIRSMALRLGGIVYFAYRCIRLPARAMRDLAAMMRQRRQSNRPLFRH